MRVSVRVGVVLAVMLAGAVRMLVLVLVVVLMAMLVVMVVALFMAVRVLSFQRRWLGSGFCFSALAFRRANSCRGLSGQSASAFFTH
jgi:hypothetical protein